MSMIARPGLIGHAACAVVALLLPVLSGCQSPPSAESSRAIEPWHVLERVGNVRSAMTSSALTEAIQPGDIIVNGRIVSTGKGGSAILKGNGLQLTLGDMTSVQLPTAAMSDLVLNSGRLRVRAATAVNQTTRIVTEDFDIHSASTTFLLLANPDGATLSVDSGSVVLTTRDGLYRTLLSSGASAMINRVNGDDVMIKRASNETYEKLAPLAADMPDQVPASLTAAPPTIDSPNKPKAEEATVDAIIRLASRPRAAVRSETKRTPEPNINDQAQATMQPPIDPMNAEIVPALSQPKPAPVFIEPLNVWPLSTTPVPSVLEDDESTQPPSRAPDLPNELDPLKLQFELLTEGLTEDL